MAAAGVEQSIESAIVDRWTKRQSNNCTLHWSTKMYLPDLVKVGLLDQRRRVTRFIAPIASSGIYSVPVDNAP